MDAQNAFFAYSSSPEAIGQAIELAASNVRNRSGLDLITWRHVEICGHFISEQALTQIESRAVLVADITRLNFNVVYEIGFAIGKGKPVYLVKNDALNVEEISLSELGIFDTLGYEHYRNSDDLTRLLLSDYKPMPIDIGGVRKIVEA